MRLVSFDPKIGADLPFSIPVSEDEDGPVLHYSEPDFGVYIKSASKLDDEKEARELCIFVPDINLPDWCWSSSPY